jgi:hypothetical protein
MTEGFAAADKTKPYIALNSAASDRGYKDGQATATCLCGAVQLAFVSRESEPVAWRTQPPPPPVLIFPFICLHISALTIPPAHRRPRSSQHLRVQLRRLPQAHRLHVRLQLWHRRQVPNARTRPRQPQILGQQRHSREARYHNDGLLLQYVRHASVSHQLSISDCTDLAHRFCG